MNKFSGMYSNLAQQECVFTSDACNEVVSTFLVTNEYICHTENSFYTLTYDANGNRTEYVSANGNVVAQYQYSAFGEIISQSGESFTHRFSTKPYCPTTGLIEYQFRKYEPILGRWLSRDPIEEAGGLNLYAFCGNSIMGVDVLGFVDYYIGYREWNPKYLFDPGIQGIGKKILVEWSFIFKPMCDQRTGRLTIDIINSGIVEENLEVEKDSKITRIINSRAVETHTDSKIIYSNDKKSAVVYLEVIARNKKILAEYLIDDYLNNSLTSMSLRPKVALKNTSISQLFTIAGYCMPEEYVTSIAKVNFKINCSCIKIEVGPSVWMYDDLKVNVDLAWNAIATYKIIDYEKIKTRGYE